MVGLRMKHGPTCACKSCWLVRMRKSDALKAAKKREVMREIGKENVAEFRERVEGRSIEDWHRDIDI